MGYKLYAFTSEDLSTQIWEKKIANGDSKHIE
jgi:hypothetical protein